MNHPVITVITVCRNAEALLEATMHSVLAQDYDALEYIIIDGASTDGTVDIIRRHADHLAYWVSEPDRGIYDAMNKGLRHATGQWVAFMNAGDSYTDEHVLRDIFSPSGRCYLDAEALRDVKVIGGHIHNHYQGEVEVHRAESPSVIPYRLPICHQAAFTRREINEGKGTFYFDCDYKFAADYNLFYHIYYKCGGESAFAIVDRIVAECVQEESVTNLNQQRVKGEYLAIQSSHLSWRWVKEYIKWRWF